MAQVVVNFSVICLLLTQNVSADSKISSWPSRTEFENIVEVKTKEMRDMWRGGRSKSIRKN